MRTRQPRRWRWILAAVVLLLMGLWFAARVPDVVPTDARAKYATAASRFMTVEPGLSVHYRDEGPRDALPVVLLHGSNASLQTWEPWVARLTGRYRVITLDFPGHGLTGANPRRAYASADFQQVVTEVLAGLRVDRAVIGGNSMGGGVAAGWAAAHPDRVLGLILVDSAGVPFKGDAAKLPIGFRIARTPVLRNLVEDITPRMMIARSLEQTYGDPKLVTPAIVDRYWELLRYPGNRQATIDRFSAGYSTLDAAALARVTAPAAIVWGQLDRLIPVDNAGWFSKTLPNAHVTILGGVGHVPMEEAPDRSLQPVLALLAQIAWAAPERPAAR